MEIFKSKLPINSQRYLLIIKLIRSKGGSARLVGGVVRDALVDVNNEDIDIATDLKPEQVIDLLQQNNIRVVPTGIKHGTVSAIIRDETFEITTLRQDISCDGRRAEVEFSDDFQADAARRDFTINALSYCPIDHKIYDYFNGVHDLEKQKVVFIGNADDRIQEDYLRILRFFRFSCRFAQTIDQNDLKACIRHKYQLNTLSRERIKSEMDKILPLGNSSEYLSIMSESSILYELFPLAEYNDLLHLDIVKISKLYQSPVSLCTIYAMLFVNSKMTKIDFLNLRFSKTEASCIIKLINLYQLKTIDILSKLKHLWLDNQVFVDYFIFASAISDYSQSIDNLYKTLTSIDKPKLPINGNDLIKLGLINAKLGRVLALLKQEWIDSNFTLQKNDLINLVPKYAQ
ncbi:MAG: CCA tRNA nucleotidyltransferase [Rickettsiaceae bacterium]